MVRAAVPNVLCFLPEDPWDREEKMTITGILDDSPGNYLLIPLAH